MKIALSPDSQRQLEHDIERLRNGKDIILQAARSLAWQCEVEINGRVRLGWQDHTGNLFSSIGVVIGMDGKPIEYYGFGGKGTAGKSLGRQAAADGIKGTSGIVIAAVAAVDYADEMEARGIVVLESVKSLLSRGIEPLVREYVRKMKEEIQ